MICDFCGTGEAEVNIVKISGYEACMECLESIVENEAERRGEREERRRFEAYHSGAPTPDDVDREALKQAGRYRG